MNCNLKYRNRRKVWWKPGPKKMDPLTWKIYCQDGIQIPPGSITSVTLSFGVEMSEGATLVSLVRELKELKCAIQNGVLIENTPNIEIIIQNNSTESIAIEACQELCLLRYVP